MPDCNDPHVQRTLALLDQLKQIAFERNDQALAGKLIQASQKLQSNLFVILVVGEVKRGKSSFINALLGDSLLPHDVTPTTSIITTLNYGHTEQIRVIFEGDHTQEPWNISRERLWEYVTEKGNQQNQKRVDRVDVFYPCPYLRNGIAIVDTPGIGGLLSQHRKITDAYLSHADAVCFVLGSDPPLTQSEYDFLQDVQDQAGDRFLFVQTKMDLQPENEWKSALQSNQALIEKACGKNVRIFAVSAKRKLMAAEAADPERAARYVARSGFPQLTAYLEQALIQHKDHWMTKVALQTAAESAQLLGQGIHLEWSAYEGHNAGKKAEHQTHREAALKQLEQTQTELRRVESSVQALERKVSKEFRSLKQQIEEQINQCLDPVKGSLVRRLEDYVSLQEPNTLRTDLPRFAERAFVSELKPLQTRINQEIVQLLASARNALTELLHQLQTAMVPLPANFLVRSEPMGTGVASESGWLHELRSSWYGKLLGTGAGVMLGFGLSLTVPAIALLSAGGTFIATVIEQRTRRSQQEEQLKAAYLEQIRRWVTGQHRRVLHDFRSYSYQAEHAIQKQLRTEASAAMASLQHSYEQAQRVAKTSYAPGDFQQHQHLLERHMALLQQVNSELHEMSDLFTDTSSAHPGDRKV